jgi:hypothetical protein
MACPICGRVYCDHEPEERGQTREQMMADLDREGRSRRVKKPKKEKTAKGKKKAGEKNPYAGRAVSVTEILMRELPIIERD